MTTPTDLATDILEQLKAGDVPAERLRAALQASVLGLGDLTTWSDPGRLATEVLTAVGTALQPPASAERTLRRVV
ncbi:hypothetical protein KSP35_22780 [Aquihabitans sp. G128]|uniref:hypothetical protein n=1 Tax=Aquihabitans sp. G128 TaxID=2849779 RepID=UPI001C225FD3|nr:hypothetical protein [Aquihabitans sp. G128]QXC61103.1 hypothetical protein KSP35_22780 [Aquihabitans sp. G128]